MRGIVGYLGVQPFGVQSALDVVLAGLRRLQTCEHDSAGVAVLADGGLAAARAAGPAADSGAEPGSGPVAELDRVLARRPLPTGGSAVGHLRRASCGAPAEGNAHPQLDGSGRVAVVHDGEIANHAELRRELATRGHALASDTDTEVVAHLLAEALSSCGEPAEAMRQVCRALRGTFALAAVGADAPDTLLGACRGLPLAVGLGDGEGYLAADPAAFPAEVVEVVRLGPAAPGDAGGDAVAVLRREGDEVRLDVTDAEGGVVRA